MITRHVELALVILQGLQVLFLWTHDWVPLGRMNDVAAVRRADSTQRLLLVTLVQSAPFSFGLLCSLLDFGRSYPHWLYEWLLISYGLLLVGQLRAWWLPYLLRPEPERAARYRVMFGNTHSLLPERNGITPNTAHLLLHLATAATLVFLAAASSLVER